MMDFIKGALIVFNIISVFYLVSLFTAEFVTWCRGDKYEDKVYDGFLLPKTLALRLILGFMAGLLITFTLATWKDFFG